MKSIILLWVSLVFPTPSAFAFDATSPRLSSGEQTQFAITVWQEAGLGLWDASEKIQGELFRGNQGVCLSGLAEEPGCVPLGPGGPVKTSGKLKAHLEHYRKFRPVLERFYLSPWDYFDAARDFYLRRLQNIQDPVARERLSAILVIRLADRRAQYMAHYDFNQANVNLSAFYSDLEEKTTATVDKIRKLEDQIAALPLDSRVGRAKELKEEFQNDPGGIGQFTGGLGLGGTIQRGEEELLKRIGPQSILEFSDLGLKNQCGSSPIQVAALDARVPFSVEILNRFYGRNAAENLRVACKFPYSYWTTQDHYTYLRRYAIDQVERQITLTRPSTTCVPTCNTTAYDCSAIEQVITDFDLGAP